MQDDKTLPSPATTLAILLGASQFPKAGSLFEPSDAFGRSATDFRAYLLDEERFFLPRQNLLDLFDSPLASSQMDEEVGDFLKKSLASSAIRDVIVYYVGHGGFSGGQADYFLAIRDTRPENDLLTSYSVRSLAQTLKGCARHTRRFLIFDSCFSAASYKEFMSGGPIEVARQKTLAELPPEKGCALLCASGPRDPARAPTGQARTMFSGAMLDVLNELPPGATPVSFSTLAELTEERIRSMYEDLAVRPEIHFPEQAQGRIGNLPLFPGPGSRRLLTEVRLGQIEASLHSMHNLVERLGVQVKAIQERPSDTLPPAVAVPSADDNRERFIAGYTVKEDAWRTVPARVKTAIHIMQKQAVNRYVWLLLVVAVITCNWLLPLTQMISVLTFRIAVTAASVMLATANVLAMRMAYLIDVHSVEPAGPWRDLDVVVAVDAYRSGQVAPGMFVERRVLAYTLIFTLVNALASVSLFVTEFSWVR
jgi:hypothetical protein